MFIQQLLIMRDCLRDFLFYNIIGVVVIEVLEWFGEDANHGQKQDYYRGGGCAVERVVDNQFDAPCISLLPLWNDCCLLGLQLD